MYFEGTTLLAERYFKVWALYFAILNTISTRGLNFWNYSRVPLSRTPAISNFGLSGIKALSPSAFIIRLVEIFPAISNTRYLYYLEPLLRSLENFSVVISNFFQKSVRRNQPFWMFFINKTFYSILNVYQCGYFLFEIPKFQKNCSCGHQIAGWIRCKNEN